MIRPKKDELFIFTMKMSAIDQRLLDELCSSLDLSKSDVMKCAMYEFAVAQKEGLLKGSLRELARLKQMDFKMQVMKEVEHITHRQAYYLDGLMSTLKDYHSKYVPVDIVRRYITVKIISIYTLYSQKQRKEFLTYLFKHFMHFYPNQKGWLRTQVNYIRSMKKNEKDELLARIAGTDLIGVKDNTIDFSQHIGQDGSIDPNVMEKLPVGQQKAVKAHLEKEKATAELRNKFYQNKNKYFKDKEAGRDGNT